MSKLRIYGDISGYVDIAVPDNAGTTTLNLDKIPQADLSGNVAIDTDTLYVDAANDRVGIGTTTPTNQLHVYSGQLQVGHSARLLDAETILETSSGKWSVFSDYGTDVFGVYKYGTNAGRGLIIDGNRNIGIGTDSPDSLMHLYSTSGDTILTIEADPTDTVEHDNPQIHFLTDGGLRTAAITGGNATNEGAGFNYNALNLQSQTIRFLTSSSQDFNLVTEQMRITSNGRVGIGTDNPQYDVDIHVANDDGLNIKGSTDTGNGWRIKPSGNDLHIGQSGVADRITLQDGGHFGINNTNPGYQLHVTDNTTWEVASLASSYATGTGLNFLTTGAGGSDWSIISQGSGGGAGPHNLGFHLTNNQSGSGGTGYRMILAPDGSLQLSNGGTPTIKTGIGTGRALTIVGEGTGNTGGSVVKMTGRNNNAGAGFVQTEVYALTGVTSNVEISRITGTGANGFRMLVEVTCTGHTGSRGNAHSIKKAYWDGGTSSVFLISEEQSDTNPINVNIQCPSSNVLRVLLSSSDGTNGFNGVMEIKYYVPVDFAGSTWATS